MAKAASFVPGVVVVADGDDVYYAYKHLAVAVPIGRGASRTNLGYFGKDQSDAIDLRMAAMGVARILRSIRPTSGP